MNRRRSTSSHLACLALVLIGLLLPSSCSKPEQNGLVILNPASERDYFFDFGLVAYGKKVTHIFEIKNEDIAPITIEDMTPSCACSAPSIEYTSESGEIVQGNRIDSPVIVIPPGAVARLEVEVDTHHIRYKNTDKLTMVVVRSDSVTTPFLTLELHIIATQAYQASPEEINLGDVPISSGARSKSDVITGVPGTQYRLLDVIEKSEGLEVHIVEDVRMTETLWQVQVELLPQTKLGPWKGRVLLSSTGPDGTGVGDPLEIPVRGQVVPDVVAFPPAFGFYAGTEGAGPRAEGMVRALAPGHRIKIIDVEIDGDVPAGIQVSFDAEQPDASGKSSNWSVALEAPTDLQVDAFSGYLLVTLEDEQLEPLKIKFIYRRS